VLCEGGVGGVYMSRITDATSFAGRQLYQVGSRAARFSRNLGDDLRGSKALFEVVSCCLQVAAEYSAKDLRVVMASVKGIKGFLSVRIAINKIDRLFGHRHEGGILRKIKTSSGCLSNACVGARWVLDSFFSSASKTSRVLYVMGKESGSLSTLREVATLIGGVAGCVLTYQRISREGVSWAAVADGINNMSRVISPICFAAGAPPYVILGHIVVGIGNMAIFVEAAKRAATSTYNDKERYDV